MRALLVQIMKFWVVGGIAFIIDFAVMNACMLWLGMSGLLAGLFSFIISLSLNFILSMRFVFTAHTGCSIRRQAAVFLFASVIGLVVNECILWLAVLLLPAVSS